MADISADHHYLLQFITKYVVEVIHELPLHIAIRPYFTSIIFMVLLNPSVWSW